ncbi:MAG TPA: DUF600 family protein [Candidatus Aphodovivens excrementavium]|nr:DUF600 family protein [Candidatus Aphodovivens excrementavium]
MSEKVMLQSIVSILERTLPDTWESVVFYAEYPEDAFSIEYYAKTQNGSSYVKCFDIPGISRSNLLNDFIEIDKVIAPERDALSPSKRWNAMTLVLQSDGKFRIDYDYSDVSSLAYSRKKEWKARYLT